MRQQISITEYCQKRGLSGTGNIRRELIAGNKPAGIIDAIKIGKTWILTIEVDKRNNIILTK